MYLSRLLKSDTYFTFFQYYLNSLHKNINCIVTDWNRNGTVNTIREQAVRVKRDKETCYFNRMVHIVLHWGGELLISKTTDMSWRCLQKSFLNSQKHWWKLINYETKRPNLIWSAYYLVYHLKIIFFKQNVERFWDREDVLYKERQIMRGLGYHKVMLKGSGATNHGCDAVYVRSLSEGLLKQI